MRDIRKIAICTVSEGATFSKLYHYWLNVQDIIAIDLYEPIRYGVQSPCSAIGQINATNQLANHQPFGSHPESFKTIEP